MRSGDLRIRSAALDLQRLIRARGDYAHVSVRPRAGHLNVEVTASDGERIIVARATPISDDEFGLSFRRHTGQWEPMPVSGTLQEIADGLTTLLAPYLDRANIA
jgi:hypothetical protein